MSLNIRSFIKRHKSFIFIALIIFLTLRVILPQLSELGDSLAALDTANLYWVALGFLAYMMTIPAGTIQYIMLALKPLEFWLTFKVQGAVLFVGKLLPQSVGSISLNVFYLMKKKHTASQSAAVMTMDGITSGIAYTTLIIVGLLISPLELTGLQGDINISTNLIIFVCILLLGVVFWLWRSDKMRSRIKQTIKDLKTNFASYKQKPWSVVGAMFFNGFSSVVSIFALWASANAIGVDLGFSSALLAYTFGNVAATLIPTPGGIGAVEAGIYAGLVLVGIAGTEATLITLLYRLVTYWIPFIPGYIAFWSLRKNLLAGYKVGRTAETA